MGRGAGSPALVVGVGATPIVFSGVLLGGQSEQEGQSSPHDLELASLSGLSFPIC